MTKIENNTTLLNAALEGLELQKSRIEEQIKSVRVMLGGGGKPPKALAAAEPAAAKSAPARGSKRELSEAARDRIAAAQKKRWNEYRKNKAEKQD